MLWLVGPALAQDIVVWDFDTTVPTSVSNANIVFPQPAHDGKALLTPIDAGDFPDTEFWASIEDRYLVTRREMSFRAGTNEPAPIWPHEIAVDLEPLRATESFELGAGLGGPPYVVDAPCGSEVEIVFYGWGTGSLSYYGLGSVYVDDIAQTGAVCDIYVDGDGDGLCNLGHDLDADATCEDPGEPIPGDTPGVRFVDCDDTVAGRECLRLTVGMVVPGSPVTLTATSALPGDTVGFLGSETLGSWCPASFGGSCADLEHPRRLGFAVADDTGSASIQSPVPAGVTAGDRVWFQAVARRPAEPVELAPAVEVVYEGP